MPRKDYEEQEEQEQIPEAKQNIVEVEVNLNLINNKLNYLIAKIDELNALAKDPAIQ